MKLKFSLNELVLSLFAAFAFSLFFTVIVPLQTILANQDMFDYSVWSLLPQMALYFAMLFVASFVLTGGGILGRFPAFMLLLIAICGYLEVGVLSLGLPPVNGALADVNRPSFRKVFDLAVFALIFLLGVISFPKIKKCLGYMILGFFILSAASVFDAHKPKSNSVSNNLFESGYCDEIIDVWKSAKFSTQRNIIMLVIDATPGDIALDVLNEDELLKSKFTGFTAFKNNIGMHERTLRGVPSLVSGSYLEKDETTAQHLAKFYDERQGSFVPLYLKAGYEMYIAPQCARPFTNNRTSHTKQGNTPNADNKFLQYTSFRPYVNLRDIVFYRLLNWRKKGPYISKAAERGEHECSYTQYDDRENAVYGIISQGGETTNRTFHYYHTPGVHTPIMWGRNGELLDHETERMPGFCAYLHYVLEQIGYLVDNLKRRGIYDQTMLLVMADHGPFSTNIAPSPKWAMLWVKPFNSAGIFKISEAPTSHAKIAEVMRKTINGELSEIEIENILTMPKRRLRIAWPTPEKWWFFGKALDTFDFIYDEQGNEISRKNLGRFATW